MDPIRAVQQQIDVTDEQAEQALAHTKGNVTEAILHLYNVPPPPPKPKTEWDERRAICDSYEYEMTQFIEKNSVCKAPTLAEPNAPPVRTIFRNPNLS